MNINLTAGTSFVEAKIDRLDEKEGVLRIVHPHDSSIVEFIKHAKGWVLASQDSSEKGPFFQLSLSL